MEKIALSKSPSLGMTIDRDGVSYALSFRTFGGMTFATVAANGTTVASSVRCIGGSWLIPYAHLMGDGGNFRFECSDAHYPHYENFGGTAVLCYYPPAEYEEANG